MIHKNSLESIKILKPGGSHNKILQVHHKMGRPLTDREVKEIGQFDDLNDVRPRTTELLDPLWGSRLEYFDDVVCVKTKKKVRRTLLKGKQMELF